MRLALFAIGCLLIGCAAELPKKKDSSSSEPSSVATSNSPASAKTGTLSQLLELKSQNDAMCLRVQKQRVECPVAGKSLQTEDDQNVLGCVSGVAANAKVESKFELDITIPAGSKAILTTKNGMWQTQAVGSGNKQKLTWGPRSKKPCDLILPKTSTLTRSPRVLELSDLSLKIYSDNCSDGRQFRTGDVGTFNLSLNGTPLFGKGDLSDSGGAIQVALTKIISMSQDPKCFVPKAELQKLMDVAKAGVSKESSEAAEAPSDLEEQIARETNRNDQLMKMLEGSGNFGCWGYSKIKKLQVKIEGAAVENKDLGDSRGRKDNYGNPRGYTFTLGQNMTHTISDETQNAIFRPGGGFTSNSFADREIQELRNFSLRKEGASFQNDAFCRPCGFFGAWHGFHRYERDRRALSKVSIFANDQLVFEMGGINQVFEDGNLTWSPSRNGKSNNIQNSPEFIKLMTRTDCPAD